ncbi:hypothetical protein OPQ81_002883 [Rhizoctonia solani]|nr:hypothetical protein OPQ81_002883 [Rhizoctonia solani]
MHVLILKRPPSAATISPLIRVCAIALPEAVAPGQGTTVVYGGYNIVSILKFYGRTSVASEGVVCRLANPRGSAITIRPWMYEPNVKDTP